MDAKLILEKMASLGQETGLFGNVLMHEPKSAPAIAESVTLALIAGPLTPIESSGLNSASLRWEVTGRIFKSALTEPADEIDPALVTTAQTYYAALCGAFTLGGLVRCIDIWGMDGDKLAATPGYMEQDKFVFRTMDLVIPLLLNDVLELTP